MIPALGLFTSVCLCLADTAVLQSRSGQHPGIPLPTGTGYSCPTTYRPTASALQESSSTKKHLFLH